MIGYPKILNTKEDYLYVQKHFGKSKWKKDFQDLLDTMRDWFDVGEVESVEAGQTDETHRVIPIEHENADGEKTVTFMQQEFRINENCRLYQLGFTEDEVKDLLED